MMAFILIVAAIIKWRPSGIWRCCRQLLVWGNIVRYKIKRVEIKMEELQTVTQERRYMVVWRLHKVESSPRTNLYYRTIRSFQSPSTILSLHFDALDDARDGEQLLASILEVSKHWKSFVE